MAIDPSIPLGVERVRINTPFENLAVVMEARQRENQARAQELALKRAQTEDADREQLRAVWQQYGDDPEKALAETFKISPELGTKLKHDFTQAALSNMQLHEHQLAQQEHLIDTHLSRLAGVRKGDDEAWQFFRGKAIQVDPGLQQELPEHLLTDEDVAKRDASAMRGEQARAMIKAQREELNRVRDDARQETQFKENREDRQLQREAMQQQRDQMAEERRIDNARADQQLALSRGNLAVSQGHLKLAQEQAAKQSASTASTAIPSEYADALDRSMLKATPKQKETAIALADRLAKAGDTAQLKEVIRQMAMEGENVDARNQIRGRQGAVAAISDIKSMLQELKASGVDTNVLRGSVEDAARKLGTSTNPKLAELGARIGASFIEYRRAMTGVQFSPEESKEYQKIWPGYSNSLPLNEALISGMQRAMATQDRAYWTGKLGEKGARLVGAIVDEPTTTTKGSAGTVQRRNIKGGGVAEFRDGKWIRVQ